MSARERTLDVERLLAQSDWARGLALRLLGDAQLADDVVQDAWVAALERPPQGARLREWFAVVVRNLALRRRRREAARVDVERRAALREPPAGPDAALERLQLQRRLADLVLALEEPCRTAVVLRHLEGLSTREIAARMGCSEEAARARVSRGLARLRAGLDTQAGGDRGLWCGAFAALWGAARDGSTAPVALSGASAGAIGGTLVGAKTILAVAAVGVTLGGMAWLARDGAPARRPAAPEAVGAIQPGPLETRAAEREPETVSAPAASVRRDAVEAPAPSGAGAAPLAGRTLDDQGVPLMGVEVALLEHGHDGVRAAATSDAAGTFAFAADALAGEPGERIWRLRATLDGHMPAEVERDGPALGDLVLVRRPVISGVLLAPDGTPAAPPGRVEFTVQDASGEQRGMQADIDALGRFTTSDVVPGRLLEAKGLARGFGRVDRRLDLELAPGSAHALTLTLALGSIVRGVVVDADSERPVPFAEVWADTWTYDAGSVEASTVADDAGRFELRGVNLNEVQSDSATTGLVWVSVSARAPGYLGRSFDPRIVREGSDGTYGGLVISITRTDAALSGRVTWPDGSPAGGVLVYGLDVGSNFHHEQTDGDGRFEFEGLPPGTLSLCARTQRQRGDSPRGRADGAIELRAGERETIELELATGREHISGRVFDATGAGVADVLIEAGEHFLAGNLTMGMDSHTARTDASGRYRLEGLAPGRYQVEISGAERRERAARPSHEAIDLVAGEPREGVDFELVPAMVCAGWVDVGDADPTAFQVARLRSVDGEEIERRELGSDGSFRFEGCWPEACVLVLSREGRELARIAVGPAGGQGLVLAAPR